MALYLPLGRMSTSGVVGSARRQSTYKQDKRSGPAEGRRGPVEDRHGPGRQDQGKCPCCGARAHGNGSYAAREKDCKAFNKKCSKCGNLNHFAQVCRSTTRLAATVDEEQGAHGEEATNGAFGFGAIQDQEERVQYGSGVHLRNRFEALPDGVPDRERDPRIKVTRGMSPGDSGQTRSKVPSKPGLTTSSPQRPTGKRCPSGRR